MPLFWGENKVGFLLKKARGQAQKDRLTEGLDDELKAKSVTS